MRRLNICSTSEIAGPGSSNIVISLELSEPTIVLEPSEDLSSSDESLSETMGEAGKRWGGGETGKRPGGC